MGMGLYLIFMIIIGLVSYQAFQDSTLRYKLIFNPYQVKHSGEWYRFVTHGFIHADWNHLIFNMLSFYFFAPIVEQYFKGIWGPVLGSVYFVLLFVGAMVVSSLKSYIQHQNNHYYNSLGASGGVSAVIFAAILFMPTMKMSLILIPIPITAYIFGALYLVYSHYMAKKGIDNIGHDAHFWGAVYGFIFPILLEPAFFSEFIRLILNGYE